MFRANSENKIVNIIELSTSLITRVEDSIYSNLMYVASLLLQN